MSKRSKSLTFAAKVGRMLTLMGIGMLPVTSAYALTCADLWRGWVYASSGVLGNVSGSQEADLPDHQENIAETFEQLKRSLESEGDLSSDNVNVDKRMAYDAGFFHGYIHVFGLSSQHIDLPVDSGHQEWAQVVGQYLDTNRERLKEFAPLCIEDALVDAYRLR
ncbi:MAG: hypothetical protein CL401_00615 [Acidiferrobacteraceae bacterium]|nr:hypothetical protein [Acidiferrobacteraceae bacterium]|tara:strand:- start:435 stop:926 length:492 start_codon:yes stop_codon:yes gene_type:complete